MRVAGSRFPLVKSPKTWIIFLVVVAGTIVPSLLAPGAMMAPLQARVPQSPGIKVGDNLQPSATSPFVPDKTITGRGANLIANNTINATTNDFQQSFAANENTTIPVIAPYNTNFTPAANISEIDMKFISQPLPSIFIPWNESASYQNITMSNLTISQTVAQSFSIPSGAILRNVSFFAQGIDNIILDDYVVNITVLQGSVNSSVKDTGMTWGPLNRTYPFPDSTTIQQYNFTLPSTAIEAGTHTIKVTITAILGDGSVDFGIVNPVANPSYIAYNYTGSAWAKITGDFAFKVGLSDPFENASIQAKVGNSTPKPIAEPGLSVSFGVADGGPWQPTLFYVRRSGIPLPELGVNITVRSNASFDTIVALNVTYINESSTVLTARSFSLAGNAVAWNASYNASIPAWTDTPINNTLYTLHRLPSTQVFTIAVPRRWSNFNATGPASIAFGNSSIATVTSASNYPQKVWTFVAASTGISTTLSVNPAVAIYGQTLHVNGTLSTPFAGKYSGNESFWTNQTTMYWNAAQTLTGSAYSFTTNFTIPQPSIMSSGFYAILAILDNGTSLAWASKQVQVKFATIAALQGNTTSGNLQGPANSQITGIVRYETVGNTTGITNANISTTWGPQGTAWYAVPATGVPGGTYDIHLNTNSSYCSPGASILVVVSFSRNDSESQNVSFVVHPWKVTSISHSALPATIRVNETVQVGINYTDNRGTVLRGVGTTNTTTSYSLNGYANSSLKAPLVPGTSSTCTLDLNTTNIPLETKAGTYTLHFSIQTQLANGTDYAPANFNATVQILPLVLGYNITRFDASFNATLGELNVSEYENTPNVPLWINITKQVQVNESTSLVVQASGLDVSVTGIVPKFTLVEAPGSPGLYEGFVDLSNVNATVNGQLNITVQGNDVGTLHVIVQLHVIARYVLVATFVGNPQSVPASGLQGLQLVLRYQKNDTWIPYGDRNVTLYITIYDGTIAYVSSINVTTRANGTIALVLPTISGFGPGSFLQINVATPGDKSISVADPAHIEINITISFWERNIGLAIMIVAIAIIGCAFFLKRLYPRLRAKRDENRIATIRDRQMEAAASRVKIQIGEDRDTLDPSTIRTGDTFSLVHMGPPDTIDLDMAAIAGPPPTTRKAKLMSDLASENPFQKHDLETLDWQTDMRTRLTTALGKATELEMAGQSQEAILFFTKAKNYALKLGNKDQVATLEKKIEELTEK
jgi:hypothetical protein